MSYNSTKLGYLNRLVEINALFTARDCLSIYLLARILNHYECKQESTQQAIIDADTSGSPLSRRRPIIVLIDISIILRFYIITNRSKTLLC